MAKSRVRAGALHAQVDGQGGTDFLTSCAFPTLKTESVCLVRTHARTEHTQAMSTIVVCILAALLPFHAKPAAALHHTAAGPPADPIVEEGLLGGGDARPRRHSKSGYIVQAGPEAELKKYKAGHAAGASCHLPHPKRAPCHQKFTYGAHALVTRNTCRRNLLYHAQPFAECKRPLVMIHASLCWYTHTRFADGRTALSKTRRFATDVLCYHRSTSLLLLFLKPFADGNQLLLPPHATALLNESISLL